MTAQKTILVTGGAGFIGSCVVRQWLAETPWRIVCVDKLTYAGNLASLDGLLEHPSFALEVADIADSAAMADVFQRWQPDAVVHLAAESHVDRSIAGPAEFIQTNIVGTFVLLEAARTHWQRLTPAAQTAFRFLHVSTDEVFGSLGAEGSFDEISRYAPNSPYAASKAGADHLVRAWQRTYGLPVLIASCANNYGPRQFPEKLIPLMLLNALAGESLPVYGDGMQVRDWLFVEDQARALRAVLERGQAGDTYCVSGGAEWRNLDLVQKLCDLLDELRPVGAPHRRLIRFVADRLGHDRRYSLDSSKIRRDLGWQPQEAFENGLRKTVQWYMEHPDWLRQVSCDGMQRRVTKQKRASSTD